MNTTHTYERKNKLVIRVVAVAGFLTTLHEVCLQNGLTVIF